MEMKRCGQCKKDLPIVEFSKSKANRDGLQTTCKECKSIYNKKYRQENREKMKEYNRTWKEENPDKHREYRASVRRRYKEEWKAYLKPIVDLSCSKCGYDEHFVALDFHHVSNKDFGIATMLQNKPTDANKTAMRKEIEKCIVLCSNCHRVHHWGGTEP